MCSGYWTIRFSLDDTCNHKNYVSKTEPRVINYKDYKHFNNERFRDDLLSEISNSYLEFDNSSFDEFSICADQH